MGADQSTASKFVVVVVVFCERGFDGCATFIGFWSDYCGQQVKHEQGHVLLKVPGTY